MKQESFLSALAKGLGSKVSVEDEARKVAQAALWNGACDAKPCAVVSCSLTEDVRRSIQIATEYGVALSVLGGGNHWAGIAVVAEGLVLDLRPMSQVYVDPAGRTVTVGGGSLTSDLLKALPDDLVAVTAAVSSVGVVGVTLGGGYGPLNSCFGLASDTMQSAQVVLADGNVVTASAEQNPDLFWALRGGGGNYGVVTSMQMELYSVAQVLGAMVTFPLSSAKSNFRRLREIIEASPDELSVLSGLITLHDGSQGVFLQPLVIGQSKMGERLFEEICSFANSKVLARQWSPYKQTFDPETEKAWSANQNYRVNARFCEQLDETVAELLMQSAERSPSAGCVIIVHDFHGKASRIPVENTAYPLRKDHYNVEVIGGWDTGPEGVAAKDWVDQVSEGLSRFSLPGGYPNVLGPEERLRVYDFYEPSRTRLQAVKTKFDPQDVFSSNVCPIPLRNVEKP